MSKKPQLLLDIITEIKAIDSGDLTELINYFKTIDFENEKFNEIINELTTTLQLIVNKNINNKQLLKNINNYIDDKIPNFFISNVEQYEIPDNKMIELRNNVQNILLIYLLTVRNSTYLKLKNNMKNNNQYYENFNKNNINKQIISYIMIPISSDFLNILRDKLGKSDAKNLNDNLYKLVESPTASLFLYTKSSNESFISIKNLCKILIDCSYLIFKEDEDNNLIYYSYNILQIIIKNILDLQKIITSLSLNYENKNSSKIYTILKIRHETTQTDVLKLFVNKYSDSVNVIYENNNYLFGPFNKIVYGKNQEIIKDTNYFFEKLDNSESVCIIGYGASGAGKTSTLIARKTEDNIVYGSLKKGQIVDKGIIYYILQKFLHINNLKLKLDITELYYNSTKKICELQDNCNNIEFYSKNNEWIYNDINILDYILDILETKRKVKYTPNNPVSSRSHLIIKISFIYELESKKNNSLIVCDFAGVENKFNCENISFPKEKINYEPKLNYIENKYTFKNKNEMLKNINKININNNYSISEFNKFLTSDDKKKDSNNINQIIKQTIDFLPDLNLLFYSDIDNFENNIENFLFNDTPIKTQGKDTVIYKKKDSTLNYLNTLNITYFIKKYKDNSKNTTFNLTPDVIIEYNKFIKKYITFSVCCNYFYKLNIKDNNNKIKIIQKLNQGYCNTLIEEGQYINDTLNDFRLAINNFINANNDVPEFNNQCLPLQCNPYYKDCFGKSKTSKVKSVLYENIIENINTGKLNFCILNVVNLNVNAHNDTNKYIDVSDLIYEYQRISNYKYRMKYLPVIHKTDEVEKINTFLTFNRIINDYYSKNNLININIFLNLKNNLKYLNIDSQKKINNYINNINNYLNSQTQLNEEAILTTNMNNIIEILNKHNSITLIGTLEFLDLMSKYGLNYTICNFKNKSTTIDDVNKQDLIKYTESFDKQIKKYILNIYEYKDRTII